MVLPGKGYATVDFQATITESNMALSLVGASLDWNDGTALIEFGPQANPLTVHSVRNLFVGSYFVTLTAWNYQSPTPQRTSAYFSIEVQPQQFVPVPNNYLFGPILPADQGAPSASTWNFNIGNNLDVLRSSVKMILITTKGERVMNPTYGTLLKQAVFEPNDNAVLTMVRQEITDAISQFEPRVALSSLSVARQGPRELAVDAQFVSKIDQTSFQLALPVTA